MHILYPRITLRPNPLKIPLTPPYICMPMYACVRMCVYGCVRMLPCVCVCAVCMCVMNDIPDMYMKWLMIYIRIHTCMLYITILYILILIIYRVWLGVGRRRSTEKYIKEKDRYNNKQYIIHIICGIIM